jgi:hypothetical protein
MIFVSVSKIFTFAFFHLVISGVSYYSCFWLELVPLVIILASVSSPGSPALSRVSVVRVLSAGKLSSCREGALISAVRTCLLAEAVFHSPEVLRSRGGSCEDLGACPESPQARNSGAGVDWKGLVPLIGPGYLFL